MILATSNKGLSEIFVFKARRAIRNYYIKVIGAT